MSTIHFDVNAVYCISLDSRSDRRQFFGESIARVLANEVQFHIVQKHCNPEQGCYESHQQLARLALKMGWDRILVFEDDVKPYELKATRSRRVNRSLSASRIRWVNRFMRHQSFEVLHLGYSMGRTWLTWFPFIARGRVVALHAYVLSREGCEILANTPYEGMPVDVVFKKKIRQHCVFPMMFRQHAATIAGSDLEMITRNEDEWWERNWRKHWKSPLRNLWRTLLRQDF